MAHEIKGTFGAKLLAVVKSSQRVECESAKSDFPGVVFEGSEKKRNISLIKIGLTPQIKRQPLKYFFWLPIEFGLHINTHVAECF